MDVIRTGEKMNKLDELIQKFENDTIWNTPERSGGKRFDKELIWLRKMIEQYSVKFNIPIDDVVDSFEENRDYSWPNYYQEANFPNLDKVENVTIYETLEEFKEKNEKFKCPACGNVYTHPTQCEHRLKKDSICNWTAGGFFQLGLQHIVIKEISLVPIAIFKTSK